METVDRWSITETAIYTWIITCIHLELPRNRLHLCEMTLQTCGSLWEIVEVLSKLRDIEFLFFSSFLLATEFSMNASTVYELYILSVVYFPSSEIILKPLSFS